MTDTHFRIHACPACGSADISEGIDLKMNAEVSPIGLSYKVNIIFHTVEPLLVDLCRRCGTIVRFFVKQTDRNWNAG